MQPEQVRNVVADGWERFMPLICWTSWPNRSRATMTVERDREIRRLMALPYQIELIPDDDVWFVRIPDLPGCISQGDTEEEALTMIRDAQYGWIATALEDGEPVPPPRPPRLLVERRPDTDHPGRGSSERG